MLRWLERLAKTFDVLERLYGLFFLGFGVLLLYWGGRGLLAYQAGVRAAWTEPLACAAGLVAGALSLWAGYGVVRKGLPQRPGVVRSELDAVLEQALSLERTDTAAGRQLLDGYFMREAAATEATREDLRGRARHDLNAALTLARELREELASNAYYQREILKKMPENRREEMLNEVEAVNQQLKSELIQLDGTIEQLRLR